MKLIIPELKRFAYVTFSALGRAVWDETTTIPIRRIQRPSLSVLSVEPYGMKHISNERYIPQDRSFSALGRAVWDET